MDLSQKYPYLDSALLAAFEGDGVDIDHDMLERLNIEAMVEHMDKQQLEENNNAISSNMDTNTENTSDAAAKENIPHNTTLSFLQVNFPNVSTNKLKRKLLDCDNDAERAFDELLDAQLIESLGVEPYNQQTEQFAKTSKRQREAAAKTAKYERLREQELDFLADKLNIPRDEAVKLYERNGQSVAKCFVDLNFTVVGGSGHPNNDSQVHSAPAPGIRSGLNPTSLRPKSAPSSTSTSSSYPSTVLCEELDSTRDKRNDVVDKMHEMSRKAKSNPLYRSAAGVYGERAQEYTKSINSFNDEINRDRIERQSSTFRVDCHEIAANVAVGYVVERLHNWRVDGCKAPFVVVTGSGSHSGGGVPKIKNMVRKRLVDGGFKYEESRAFFTIRK